jgi:hypothetical protein
MTGSEQPQSRQSGLVAPNQTKSNQHCGRIDSQEGNEGNQERALKQDDKDCHDQKSSGAGSPA